MKIEFYKGGWVGAEVRKGTERDGTSKAISAHWVASLLRSMTALQVAAWFSSWISSSRLLVGSGCSQASSAWGRKNSFTGCLSSQAGLFGLFSRVDTKTLYNLSSRRTFQAVPRWRAQGDRGIKRGICCSLYAKEIKVKGTGEVPALVTTTEHWLPGGPRGVWLPGTWSDVSMHVNSTLFYTQRKLLRWLSKCNRNKNLTSM